MTTIREPLTEDDTLSLYEEATGYFTLRTDDGCIELSPEEFADLISAGAQRLGLRFEKPAPVLRFSDAVAAARGAA